MSEYQYVELSKAGVSQDVLQKFNCGHPDLNDSLTNDADTRISILYKNEVKNASNIIKEYINEMLYQDYVKLVNKGL